MSDKLIYKAVAAALFSVPIDKVTEPQYDVAKKHVLAEVRKDIVAEQAPGGVEPPIPLNVETVQLLQTQANETMLGILKTTFPWLATEEEAEGADTIMELVNLYTSLGGEYTPVATEENDEAEADAGTETEAAVPAAADVPETESPAAEPKASE